MPEPEAYLDEFLREFERRLSPALVRQVLAQVVRFVSDFVGSDPASFTFCAGQTDLAHLDPPCEFRGSAEYPSGPGHQRGSG
jgi:hypothetical protein